MWRFPSLSLFFILIKISNGQYFQPTYFDKLLPFFENKYYQNLTDVGQSNATTCEVPIGNIHSETVCNFRNIYYRANAFAWWSGYYCFIVSQPSLLDQSFRELDFRICQYLGEAVPCVVMGKPGALRCYPFDTKFTKIADILNHYFLTDVGAEKWNSCMSTAIDCCRKIGIDYIHRDELTCPPTWDAWVCWSAASIDSKQYNVCPEYGYSNSGPSCDHFNSKTCYPNGTWNVKTDFSTCSVTPRLTWRIHFHIGCLATSMVACLPAIFIFFYYKRLRSRRVALHRNLLIAIVFRNMLVIVTRSVIMLDELTSIDVNTPMSRNEWPCKVLAVLEKLCSSSVFVCMLIDGIYIHRLIAASFRREPNVKIINCIGIFFLIGIVVIPVIIWTSFMTTINDTHCWVVYDVEGIQWILDAPRISILIINTILLADILRVLLTKLRRQSNTHRVTTKATLFLMPLFGVQFLLTAWTPDTHSCSWEQAFYIFTYVMEGSQGIIVSTLFCYWNKEVRELIKASYKETEEIVLANFRGGLSANTDRRTTFTTNLDNNVENTNEGQQHSIATHDSDTPSNDDIDIREIEEREDMENHKMAKRTNSTFIGITNPAFEGRC